MARPLSHKIVAYKMDILVEQRNYLQTFVEETDKVLQVATSWLSNEDTTKSFTFTDISMMVEDKLAFLVSKDFSVGCEEAATDQGPGAARSFPSAPKSSTDQPLPAGHVHVSGVTAEPDELKTISSQVNVMQDAMSSLSTSSKMLSEKQLVMEKLVESLSDKYSKVEQEKLREIEGELEGIKEEHKKAAIQQGVRMISFEKKIQAVTDTQSDIIENCHQQQIKIKDQKKETEELKIQSQQFTKDLRDVLENVQELNAEISALRNKAFGNSQMDALKRTIEILEDNLEGLSKRFEEHDSSLERTTYGQVLLLEQVEQKISALEKSDSEASLESEKLYRDVETKFEMVCKVVTDRLVPLERLRDIFNGKLDARTGNIKKLENVCDQMANLLPKFSHVELNTQRQVIGFSATLYEYNYKTLQSVYTLIFPDTTSNIGNHYDPTTGEFTAPQDGLYAACLSVLIKGDGQIRFKINKRPCSSHNTACSSCFVGGVYQQETGTSNTFSLVEMKATNKLLVICEGTGAFFDLHARLSCFKIN